IVDDYGAESMQATRIWFIFQERSPLSHERFLQMLDGAGETESYAAAVDVPLAGLRVVAGRVLAPLGIATNFMVMIHPEHDGWRGDVDRISGGLGVGSSAVLTAAAFGATIPGLDVVAGGVLLGVGAW